ncbi:hypothetical protein [Pedobacter aquatilis]|uniref:hypothetical protein n=1 Tax=Pedobacter aquatilis TaxID=351343 RepID=UPI00292DC570|nr:hypothetical protein [Pedobacter aquatilis]
MIKQEDFEKNEDVFAVLKINPVKLKELHTAFELHGASNSITLFTMLGQLGAKDKVIYARKSDLEIAFEAFEKKEQ